MKAYCLASSSSGNCFIFQFDINGVSQTIMVECGIPMSAVYKKCNEFGINAKDISACLITHSHGDHSKAVRELTRFNMPIFTSRETVEALNLPYGTLEPYKATQIVNGVYVYAFEVDHDAPGSYGFIIKTANETILFINDCKRWTTNLINFKPNYVFIECNYDQKVVYAQIGDLQKKLAEGGLSDLDMHDCSIKLKQHTRNINAHMSLAGCIKGLSKLNLSRCQFICLMHLSDRFANEYKMKNTIQAEFGVQTLVAGKLGGMK